MRRGFLYLVGVMDWAGRKILAWQLSNTREADFCVAVLEEAIARHGNPDIFNTDWDSQFIGFAFTSTLRKAGSRISMNDRGRWMDNVFNRPTVAFAQIRVCVPECLRDWWRGTIRDRTWDRLLQCRAPVLHLRRQDA